MKVIDGFKLRSLGKEFVVVGEGEAQVNFNKMISLNESAAFLWKEVCAMESFELEDLENLLIGKYGIDAATAKKDSAYIASKWLDFGITRN